VNGGLTYKDLDALKRKAAALDQIREFISGREDSEELIAVSDMIEKAYSEAGQ
jgi:hypothetical protein